MQRNIWFLFVTSSLSGFTAGGWELGRVTYVTRNFSSRQVQLYWGADTSFMGIRGIIFPFIGIGLMYLLGIRTAFIVSFLLMALSGVLTWLLRDKLERDKEVS